MKKKTYNIIIYISIFFAILCTIIATMDYLESKPEEEKVNEKEPEINDNQVENVITPEEEPIDLMSLDKKHLTKKYLDSLADQIKTSDILSLEMINTWSKYEILDVMYNGVISDYYYSYKVNIKVYGDNVNLPVDKNLELSTKEYSVITLNFNIYKSGIDNGYIVKSIEIPKNE